MYRHNASSIKETEDRLFMSPDEKNKILEIPNIKNDIEQLATQHNEDIAQLATQHNEDIAQLATQYNELEEFVHSNNEAMYDTFEDSYITIQNTMKGIISDIEVLGNTVQDSTNFANIKFAGIKKENGNYGLTIVTRNKNLIELDKIQTLVKTSSLEVTEDYIKFKYSGTYCSVGYALDVNKYAGKTLRLSYTKVENTNSESPVSFQLKCKTSTGSYVYIATKDTLAIPADSTEITLLLYGNNSPTTHDGEVTFFGVQMEIGEAVTSYEKPKKSIATISLPVQLKKIDNIADRLFRREDGVWCIEKNVGEAILDGTLPYTDMNINETWQKTNTSRFVLINYFKFLNLSNTEVNCINTLAQQTTYQNIVENDIEGVGTCYTDGHYLNISILKSKLGDKSITDYLKTNPIKIWYKQAPEIIELPLDVQIQLNSFAEITNIYTESGDVPAIVKGSMAKSLGASINSLVENSNQISDRITILETLQEGNNVLASTDKGYVICKDTRNGYIKDIKIEGNTLVNTLPKGFNSYKAKPASITVESGKVTIVGTGTYPSLYYDYSLFKPNTTYTFIVNVLKLNILNTGQDWCIFRIGEGDQKTNTTVQNPTNTGLYVTKFTTPNIEKILDAQTFFRPVLTDSHSVEMENLLILEGDHTTNPPEYFEGLMSTGQDSQCINIESFNTDSNLFDGYLEIGDINENTGGNISATTLVRSKEYIKIIPNTYYKLTAPEGYNTTAAKVLYFYDINKKLIKKVNECGISPSNARYCRFRTRKDDSSIISIAEVNNIEIILTMGYNNTIINNYQEVDKKQILYRNDEGDYLPIPSLRKINNNVKDMIEKNSDGKYYYHKKCGEVVLNGNESWTLQFTYDNSLTFITDTYKNTKCNNPSFITDLFNYNNKTVDGEGIDMNSSGWFCYITIPKTKLTTQDVAGFKAWLNLNPVTVVYELVNEEVYECNNIELNSYDDETLVYMNSGTISPSKLEFKTTSHLNNIIASMKEEVNKNTKIIEELTESVTSTKEFSNGYNVFENTKEGAVSIEKIEGATLVNLVDYSSLTSHGTHVPSSGTFVRNGNYFKATVLMTGCTLVANLKMHNDISNKLVTVIINNISTAPMIRIGKKTGYASIQLLDKGINILTLNRDELSEGLYVGNTNSDSLTEGDIIEFSIVVLEGDYTKDTINYFEGLKSVGEQEGKIEISTRKEEGNIFDSEVVMGFINADTGIEDTVGGSWAKSKDFIKIEPNTSYFVSANKFLNGILFFDINKKIISTTFINSSGYIYAISPANSAYARLRFRDSSVSLIDYTQIKDIVVVKNKNYSSYIDYICDKKELIYKNSKGVYTKPILRGIPNVKDTIEKHSDGKYYYHKRLGQVTFNGSEDVTLYTASSGKVNCCTFAIPITDILLTINQTLISDRFMYKYSGFSTANDFESISNSSKYTNAYISILKSRLETQDAAGFKKWLTSNPITVVYQLANEEVYECINLDLDSYEKETGVLLHTSINGKIKASAHSNLLDTIDSLKKRIAYLETEFSDIAENGTGWCKLPNGLVMQYGKTKYTEVGQRVAILYPLTFKTCYNVQLTGTYNQTNNHYWVVGGLNGNYLTGFTAIKNGDITKSDDFMWLAIGEV